MDSLTIRKQLPPTQKYVINHLLDKFIGNPHIDSIFLFGSCAKATINDDSDIDIFVVTTDKVSDDSHEAFGLLYGGTDDIPLENYVSCDILTASKEEFQRDMTPLIKTVKKEGVELIGLL
jgi:predicted nucleotidyltransferase